MLQLTPQAAAGATYANKIGKGETRIDWSQPWQRVHDHCLGLSPFPGAWCEIAGEGEPARLKILRCELASGTGAPGAVLNAVNDALAPFGARVTSQPITPEVVLKALGAL